MKTLRAALQGVAPAQLAIAALVIIPHLNPLALGPSPNAMPLLLTWMISATLLRSSSMSNQGLLFAGIGTLVAGFLLPAQSTPMDSWTMMISVLVMAGLAHLTANSTRAADRAVADGILHGWWAAALASVLIGLLQYSGSSGPLSPWINPTAPGEAFGNLRQRNLYASLTSIGLVALIGLSRRHPAWARPVVVVWLAAVLGAGNALSLSRTGLFELLMVGLLALVWGLWRDARFRQAWVAAVLGYLVAAVLLPRLLGLDGSGGIFSRLTDGAPMCASRLTLWSNVLELIRVHPWRGWGWGQLDAAHYLHLYAGERFCDILDNAHNLPLHLAVELGIPVAVGVCGLVLYALARLRPWQARDPLTQTGWSVLAIIGLHSLLEYPLWYGPFQMAAGLALGLVLPAVPAAATRGGGRVAAGLLLAAVAVGGWDYARVSQIYLPPEERLPFWRDNTLEQMRRAWIFQPAARFAELTMTPLTPDNAAWTQATATALIAYSPEPRVIEKLIESAVMNGQDEVALFHLQRFKAAFPAEHARWAEGLKLPPLPASP